MSDYQALRESAREAALAAGEAIVQIAKRRGIDVHYKGDRSPVTEADLEANRIILAALEETGIPVLSEEQLVPWETRQHWPRHWIVDPLDGTKDFLTGNGQYTVNIALIEGNRPVVGVVAAPAIGASWEADVESGAFQTLAGDARRPLRRLRPIEQPIPWHSLRCAESNFHASPQTDLLCTALGISCIIRSGSSIKLCRIAAGEIDLYPRFGPTSEWDTAAAQCIAESCGVELAAIPDGVPLRYGKENLLNPGFVAAVPGLLPSLLVEIQRQQEAGAENR